MSRTVVTRSEAETEALACELGESLVDGDVVLIDGQLGTGKTVFVRGLAVGLGIDPTVISSPTFALVHEHCGGRVTLYHVDLYRIDRTSEVADLGLYEVGAEGVLAVEWPALLGDLGPSPVRVRIETVEDDENSRLVSVWR
jgi:tRNA threonylcarbamoyladenosine biosynthesis protein TsaE